MESEKLSIQEIKGVREGEQLLKLAGSLTITTLFGFRDVVDVPYIDSAGLGVLVNAHVSCVSRGRRLALVGVVDRVHTLLAVTNVHKVLAVFPTLQEAEKVATSGLPLPQGR